MVLWTRLAGGLDPVAYPVRWEIASDEAMRAVVASGSTVAEPEWAHSVHVEPKGLEPDRWYWYRFMAGDAVSAVARTRTAPRPDAPVERLRFAFASCQQYEQGYFVAHRHIAADEPDLVAFLGDYIYESSWGKRQGARARGAASPTTLEEYRARYALYKSDPDLQAAHAACPWIVTWDDHEVDNDYADDRAAYDMTRELFLERRAAAYRAYYEHMPLPERMKPRGPDMRIYTQLGWGQLARFFVLDDRQYRSWQACPRPDRRGGSNTVDVEKCDALVEPAAAPCSGARRRSGSRIPSRESALALEPPRAADHHGAVRPEAGAWAARLDRRLGRLSCGAPAPAGPPPRQENRESGGARRRRALLQRRTT